MKYSTLLFMLVSLISIARAQHDDHSNSTTSKSDSNYYPGAERVVNSTGNTVTYHLTVSDTIVNFTNKRMHALATNGQIPAPTLLFTEGDTAELFVHNKTDKTVSFHWHGILLPNKFDGVPILTTEVINPGDTYLFKFKIIQHGTYWYHSHTELDEQIGQYGPIVIQPRDGISMKEKVIHLSDWINEQPWEVHRTLKRHSDWYIIERKAVQSYARAIATGNLGTKLWFEWNRMPDFDLADVYYDAFLANGHQSSNADEFEPGDSVRLRVINGGASSHFWLEFSGGSMIVVAADGLEIEPVVVNKVFIATAETYDLIIAIPANGSYEFRATSWDRAGHSSVWFGKGEKHQAPTLPRPDYFKLSNEMIEMGNMMDMTMGIAPKNAPETEVFPPGMAPEHKMNHEEGNDTMSMGGMHKNPLGTTMTGYNQIQAAFPGDVLLNYDMLKAKVPTTLHSDRPTRIVHLFLTGNMRRYVWSINDLPLSKADKILINKGENVRFVMHNTTMMSHPMHLHGHFFRVVNKQGEYSPLKHTVNIEPMETLTMEFAATEDKDWFFHCHLLYHMMSGMARTVSYDHPQDPELKEDQQQYKKFVSDDRSFFPFAEVQVQNNGLFGELNLHNTYWLLNVEGKSNWSGEYEIEPKVQRYFGPRQFFAAYLGGDFSRHEVKNSETGIRYKEDEQLATAGLRYFLPMSLWADLRVDHNGDFKLALEREEIPITQRWRIGASVEYDLKEDWEYTINTFYILTKYIALSANYDNEFGWGGGLLIVY